MSRNNIVLILLLIVLAIVGYIAYQTNLNNNSDQGICDLPEEEIASKFVFKDTGSVDKLVITGTDGEKVTLERQSESMWYYQWEKYNSETDKWDKQPVYRARLDAVQLLLKTFYRVELRNFVAESAHESVLNRLLIDHQQVDIYSNGKLEKTWYVGHPSKDGYGTYMLLGIPGCGKSQAPYEMKMAAFHGSLNSRFFTKLKEWRYTGLWVMDPSNLAKVVIKPFEQPDGAFSAELEGKNTFKLFDKDGNSMRRFDTTRVRDLFRQFKMLHFEKFDERLSLLQKDSLIKEAMPYYYIETTDKTGAKKSLTVYKIKVPEGSRDMAGNPIEFDVDRLYGVTDDQDVLVIQYYTFGGLFRNIREYNALP